MPKFYLTIYKVNSDYMGVISTNVPYFPEEQIVGVVESEIVDNYSKMDLCNIEIQLIKEANERLKKLNLAEHLDGITESYPAQP